MQRGSPEPNEGDFQHRVIDHDPVQPAESELETSGAPCVPAQAPISSASEQSPARLQVPVASTSQSAASPACPPNRHGGLKRNRSPERDSLLVDIREGQKAIRVTFEEAHKEELQLQPEYLKLQKESPQREQDLIDVLNFFFQSAPQLLLKDTLS